MVILLFHPTHRVTAINKILNKHHLMPITVVLQASFLFLLDRNPPVDSSIHNKLHLLSLLAVLHNIPMFLL